MELLNANGKNTVQKTINILRDQKGIDTMQILAWEMKKPLTS